MQFFRDVEFWIKVAGIGVPVISAAVVAVITFWFARKMADYQMDRNSDLAGYQSVLQEILNKELENHRSALSKELEGYKHELQSSFQTRFYEFQTRYSLLHQKKAEAIEKLFALVVRVQNDLRQYVSLGAQGLLLPSDEFSVKTQEHFRELEEFYYEKRIYFDDKTQKYAELLTYITRTIYGETLHPIGQEEREDPDRAERMKTEADGMITQIRLLVIHLEERFKELLEAETPAPVQKLAASAGMIGSEGS